MSATMTHEAGARPWPMLPGVKGSASFAGERQEHRLWLERVWAGDLTQLRPGVLPDDIPFALWIGMNPSAASEAEDDLTVRKEYTWTRTTLGLTRYVKVNVGTYRATNPGDLEAAPQVQHPDNTDYIARFAARASKIIVATGQVPPVLEQYARDLFALLALWGHPLLCLGLTKSGWPKHPSRIGYDPPFVAFKP